MDLLTKNYSVGIFSLLGFFFHGQFMNAVILALVWEFIDDCLTKDNYCDVKLPRLT